MKRNSFPMTSPWWFTDYLIRKYLRLSASYIMGIVLDVGCGEKPYVDLFKVERYIGVEQDIKYHPDVVASGEALPFGDETFDSILSTQVLEHVRDLDNFMSETTRVLRQGGYYVATVPFIGRLHQVPNDYLRFSKFGIREIFSKYGLSVIKVEPMGGFLTTQCYLWCFYFYEAIQGIGTTLLRKVAYKLLRACLPAFHCFSYLIHQIDRERLTPHNWLAVGIKCHTSARLLGGDQFRTSHDR